MCIKHFLLRSIKIRNFLGNCSEYKICLNFPENYGKSLSACFRFKIIFNHKFNVLTEVDITQKIRSLYTNISK